MADPNFRPIYTLKPNFATDGAAGTAMPQLVLNAANDYTGIDADVTLIYTAGAQGSYVKSLRFKAGGTNTASVARIYLNNGSTPGTTTNNTLIGEVTLPATTAIATAATADIDYPLTRAIPPGFRLYFGLGTAVAAGWACSADGGDY